MAKEKSINSLILGFLKSGDFVSGQTISKELGISRNAVWKHIEGLRNSGYPIEARSRKGYALKNTCSRPYNSLEIENALFARAFVKKVVYLEKTASTNTIARELAQQGEAEGTVVVADAQTSGKGRLGRAWHSPKGVNVYTSIILRPNMPPHKAHSLTLVTAVAASEAIEKVSGIRPVVKWPNDLLVGTKKIAGILSEMSSESDRIRHMIIGIGINANMEVKGLPPELSGVASSLKEISGKEVSRTALLNELYSSLEKWYKILLNDGLREVTEAWQKRFDKKGKRISVKGHGSISGICAGIDHDGALLIETRPGVTERVLSGDVE